MTTCTLPRDGWRCLRSAGHAPPCYQTPTDDLAGFDDKLTAAQAAAFDEVLREIDRAHSIHGLSVEQGTDDKRCRIPMAEAFEVSKAIDALAIANNICRFASREGSTSDLMNARGEVERCRAALRAEVVQVAAVAMRWLMAEGKEQDRG